jgi:hypothetical protein
MKTFTDDASVKLGTPGAEREAGRTLGAEREAGRTLAELQGPSDQLRHPQVG